MVYTVQKRKVKNIYGENESKVETLEPWEKQFNEFYSEYPKKLKKQEVKKWFKKNSPSSELFSSMMSSLEQFRGSKDWLKDNGQYIPYPSTWLNQERWKDEIEEVDKKESENVMYLPDGSYIKDGLHYMN